MGIFSKPKPPKIDNYQNVANQQQTLNEDMMRQLFQLTATNQANPYGNLTYVFNPATGQYTAQQVFTPEQQTLLNYLQGTQATAGQQAGDLLTAGNYGVAPDFSTAAGALTREQMDAYTGYIQPYHDARTNSLDAKLRNQGIVPGDVEYDNQMRELRDTQSREISMAAANFEPQAFQQAVTQYQMPAMMSQELAKFGAPGNIMQNLWNTPQAQGQPANLIGAYSSYNQAAMEQYKQKMANYQGMMNTLGGLGGMGAQMLMGMPPINMMGMFSQNIPSEGGWNTTMTPSPNYYLPQGMRF